MLLSFIVGAALLVVLATAGVSAWVCVSTGGDIKPAEEVVAHEADFDAECILVLGAGINYNGTPSSILRDRLDTAIDLYRQGVAPKLVMSGDNAESTYNEVMAMANYARSQGVPARDIFCDHAGVSTYDSLYRTRAVFGAQRIVVVTQEYHLYRAVYDAKAQGMQAVGVAADKREYDGMADYEKREFLARIQDFWKNVVGAGPEKMSNPVSLNQSGVVTQWW